MAKKLEGIEAQFFKKWIKKNSETIIDIDGQRYLIQLIEDNKIKKEIEADPELQEMLKRSDKNIAAGELFTTEEIIEAIERGEI